MARSILTDKTELIFNADCTADSSSFNVIIDGNADNIGGFRYEVADSYWFDVSLIDNTFTIIPRENFDISERNGYILLHHNSIQGEAGEVSINIKQNGVECEITVDDAENKEITFLSVPQEKEVEEGEEKINYEIETLTLNPTGGNERYFIKSFNEYKKVVLRVPDVSQVDEPIVPRRGFMDGEDNNNEHQGTITLPYIEKEEYVLTPNDNGIKIERLKDNKVNIISYGRVFSDINNYYDIVFAHENDPSKTCTVTVKYEDITD